MIHSCCRGKPGSVVELVRDRRSYSLCVPVVVYWRDTRREQLTVFVQSQLFLAVDRRLAVIRLAGRKHDTHVSPMCAFEIFEGWA